jgi:pyruvate/2-oxoglutarate dehydrogenase complex dihydrolipoamide dehydrogenase (E3) component
MATAAESFDALLIGSGQANNPLAGALAKAGWRVALVERAEVGGTCINWGCTPTKTMVASAAVADAARRAARYGVVVGGVAVRMAEVRRRKRAMVEIFRAGSEHRLDEVPGVTLVRGEAVFIGPYVAEVTPPGGGTRCLTAPRIFLNTGCGPARPPLDGLDGVPALDSTSIMELDVVPQHLLVLGGGYIGLEFGQMFRRFGSRVTIVQRGDQLLGREDADVAAAVADILGGDGVEVLLNTAAMRVEAPAHGEVRLTVRTAVGEQTLAGSHLLVAVGRVPNTNGLNLAAAGVQTDARGYVPVNDRLETNVPGVYALGDVNGGPAFTHISYHDYTIVRDNLLRGGGRTTRDRPVPYTVFIDPQLGRVGLTEQDAWRQGRAVKVAKLPMGHVARALEVGESRGFIKAVVDARTGQILGAAVLGLEGGEVMAMLEIAMMGRLPYTALRDGVFAHPTLAEALNNLFASFG